MKKLFLLQSSSLLQNVSEYICAKEDNGKDRFVKIMPLCILKYLHALPVATIGLKKIFLSDPYAVTG